MMGALLSDDDPQQGRNMSREAANVNDTYAQTRTSWGKQAA
jgi:hypothetical protein